MTWSEILETRGYKIISLCTDKSPVMTKDYGDGIIHELVGDIKNGFWYVEDQFKRPHQMASLREAKQIITRSKE